MEGVNFGWLMNAMAEMAVQVVPDSPSPSWHTLIVPAPLPRLPMRTAQCTSTVSITVTECPLWRKTTIARPGVTA
jgi:hypothetical protein